MATTPVCLPGKSHGWRSVLGYSPWGHREWDTSDHTAQQWNIIQTPYPVLWIVTVPNKTHLNFIFLFLRTWS